MQIRQFRLEFHMIARGAGNVARSAGAGTGRLDRLMHGIQHHGVLALTEVVVRAPYRHVLRRPVRTGPGRVREISPVTLQVGKDPVSTFLAHLIHGGTKC